VYEIQHIVITWAYVLSTFRAFFASVRNLTGFGVHLFQVHVYCYIAARR